MDAYAIPVSFPDRLLQVLARDFTVLGPVAGADGVGRLAPVGRWQRAGAGRPAPDSPEKSGPAPRRPPLASRWGRAAPSLRPPALALVGIPPCDLQGLAYLDQVFAEDLLYHRRRARLFLVGALCTPSDRCFCPPREDFPACDLFLDENRLWCGSAAGARILRTLELAPLPGDVPLPAAVFDKSGEGWPTDLERLFLASGHQVWAEAASRCLSCGACSAVCPTCYCYDVVDEADLAGGVQPGPGMGQLLFPHPRPGGGRTQFSSQSGRAACGFASSTSSLVSVPCAGSPPASAAGAAAVPAR